MSNIPAARSISSHHSVTVALFTSILNPVILVAIYYLSPVIPEAQLSYHRSHHLSVTTGLGAAFTPLNIYSTVLANNSANYGCNDHSPRYIPSRL